MRKVRADAGGPGFPRARAGGDLPSTLPDETLCVVDSDKGCSQFCKPGYTSHECSCAQGWKISGSDTTKCVPTGMCFLLYTTRNPTRERKSGRFFSRQVPLWEGEQRRAVGEQNGHQQGEQLPGDQLHVWRVSVAGGDADTDPGGGDAWVTNAVSRCRRSQALLKTSASPGFCSGVILKANLVLTSAQCARKYSSFQVAVGE